MVKASLAGFIGLLCITTAPHLSKLWLKSVAYNILFQLVSINVILVCINVTTASFLLGLNKIPEMATLNMARALMGFSSTLALLLLGYGLPRLISGGILGESAYAIPSIIITFKGKRAAHAVHWLTEESFIKDK